MNVLVGAAISLLYILVYVLILGIAVGAKFDVTSDGYLILWYTEHNLGTDLPRERKFFKLFKIKK